MERKHPKTLHHIISQMLQLPEEVVKSVIEKKEAGKSSYERIAKSVNRELGANLEAEDVKEIWMTRATLLEGKSLVDATVEQLNDDIETVTKYEFKDDHYIFYKNVKHPNTGEKIKKEYKLPLAYVDSIFKDYSRHGGHLSQQQIFDKYNLKPEVWNMLKSRLGLYKDSHVLSPMSLDKADKEGVIDEVIYHAAHQAITDRHKQKFIKTCDTILIEEGKKAIKIVSSWQNFFDAMAHNINYREPIKPTKLPKIKKNSDILHILLSDIHN
jgi:hypothetical protein